MSDDGQDAASAPASEPGTGAAPQLTALDDHDLLSRLSDTVRTQIAPAVDDEYARTQAYMASVILDRLARQAAMGDRHRDAEAADLARLVTELAELLGDTALSGATAASAPETGQHDARDGDADARPRRRIPSTSHSVPHAVRVAFTQVRSRRTVASLEPLLVALYSWGVERPEAGAALAAIRTALRSDINRRMEIAR